ncbi:hypothetical protein ACFW4M_24665 [Streptomyces sp. NPDC058794]|uniref:hypothetical protein n=1 Tax=Streptomyces TaxID=1883 RepID=UPI00369044BD
MNTSSKMPASMIFPMLTQFVATPPTHRRREPVSTRARRVRWTITCSVRSWGANHTLRISSPAYTVGAYESGTRWQAGCSRTGCNRG